MLRYLCTTPPEPDVGTLFRYIKKNENPHKDLTCVMFKLRPPKAAQVVSGQAQQRVRETNTEEDRETHQKDSKKMV